MRAAPAITVRLPRSLRWDAACAAAGALAAACAAAAVCAHALPDSPVAGLCVAAAAGMGGVAMWRLRPSALGELRWDGACWWFMADGVAQPALAGRVSVMVDAGRWMLLRFVKEPGGVGPHAVWLPVSDRHLAAAGALRAALHARAVTESPAP